MAGDQRAYLSSTSASLSLSLLMLVRPISASLSVADSIRIIGGTAAEGNRYPYTVALLANGRFGCAGSLISKDTVLTAAHCIRDSLTVAVGSDKVDEGERIRAIQAVKHPRYNDKTDEYDIGLLFLESSTSIDIPLPILNYDDSFPETGSTVYGMGWGDTDPDRDNLEFPDELMKVDLKVISNEQCSQAEEGGKSYKNWIFDDMLCTFTQGKDACQGDSGGPLIFQNNLPESDVIVGVTSWGVGCAVLPGVFSRVSITYEWIVETMCQESNDPPDSMCGERMSPIEASETNDPTSEPTLSPIDTASSTPSIIPTDIPSATPTLSSQPTSQPTVSPIISLNPSDAPSVSPTIVHTMTPSLVPSTSINSPTFTPMSLEPHGHKDVATARGVSGKSHTNALAQEQPTSKSANGKGHWFAALSSAIIMALVIR